jgi:hypothetical protein
MRVALEVVPDPDVAGCGYVFVDAHVSGRSVRAVLDTGAVRTKLVDLPPTARQVGERQVSGVFGTETVTEWEVADIRLGSLRADLLIVDRISHVGGRHPMLGLDLLGTQPWRLDVVDRTLDTGAPLPRSGSSFTRGANGHLLTQMRWPTATATALWDTGAGITLIDQRFADSHPNLAQPAGTAVSTDSAGATANTHLARIAGYEIDGVQFRGHTVALADLSAVPDRTDVIIGYPTIAQARWAMHIPTLRWCVER